MIQNRVSGIIKNTLTRIIKQISIIAIFIAMSVIALLYIGPDINIDGKLEARLAVPSVFLAISIFVIHELWIINGRQNAYEETDYIELLKTYEVKSANLHYPTLQKFLDYEYERRYQVEYDRLTRLLVREESVLSKKQNGSYIRRFKWLRSLGSRLTIYRLNIARNKIRIYIPYTKSEEFDYLRYTMQDLVYKEYSPNDISRHLRRARFKKYTSTIGFAVVGLNILSIGTTMNGNIWQAVIMTILAFLSLFVSVVSGFNTGYKSINTTSTGIYKTAVSFIDQAVAYCKRENEELYYTGPTDFKQYLPNTNDETESGGIDNIFTKATREVTKTNRF